MLPVGVCVYVCVEAKMSRAKVSLCKKGRRHYIQYNISL